MTDPQAPTTARMTVDGATLKEAIARGRYLEAEVARYRAGVWFPSREALTAALAEALGLMLRDEPGQLAWADARGDADSAHYIAAAIVAAMLGEERS